MKLPEEFTTKSPEAEKQETALAQKRNEALAGLDEQETALVLDFAKKIDIKDADLAVSYGVEAQAKLDTFSETVLTEARTKDLGKTGELITSVITELSDFSGSPAPKGIKGLFRRGENYVKNLRTKYEPVSKSVDRISGELREQQLALSKDNSVLESLYEQNLEYFKELSLYIAAGKVALQDAEAERRRLELEAQTLGTQEAAQAYSDFVAKMDRFQKKLLDLDTTRVISIQMAPQIRMLQANNFSLIEKIQSTILNTIPLWKSQLVIALGTQTSLEASNMQKKVSDFTNKMLKETADSLHMAAVQTAKESERGIVDIDTLKHTNAQLIATLSEVMEIQNKGREERSKTEQELRALESELKGKILELATGTTTPEETIPTTGIKLELK